MRRCGINNRGGERAKGGGDVEDIGVEKIHVWWPCLLLQSLLPRVKVNSMFGGLRESIKFQNNLDVPPLLD